MLKLVMTTFYVASDRFYLLFCLFFFSACCVYSLLNKIVDKIVLNLRNNKINKSFYIFSDQTQATGKFRSG